MKKTRKRPHRMKESERQSQADIFRAASLRIEGVDRENRSLPLVLATSDPVMAYDMTRMQIVEETLHVEGIEIPLNRQVPMIDTHEDGSVANVLGSIRDLQVSEGRLIGRAFFANDDVSRATFEKYADGHLQDFSVGALTVERQYEQSDGILRKIVTKSRLIEGSAVVAGSDRNAKAILAQRAYVEPELLRKEVMDEKLKDLLIERGLKEDATDGEILEFVERGLQEEKDPLSPTVALDIVRQLKKSGNVDVAPAEPERKDESELVQRARKRWSEIDALCEKHDITSDVRRTYLDGEMKVEEVAKDILDTITRTGKPVGPSHRIETGESERDKFYDAVHAGIVQRSLSGLKIPDDVAKEIHDVPGASDFRYRRVGDIAKEFCQRSGQRIEGLPDHEIIRKAIQIRDFVQRAGSFHTTGSFSNLFLDAMHKTLRAAYDEAPSTYQRWVRQAGSASDYKQLHRIVFGEMGLPSEVPENSSYPELTTTDSKESYRIAKYGGVFSITLEMLVNDDLDAMTRIPRMQGNSMRRKINRDAYSILTANGALSDGIALFHGSSHGANLDSNALAESALDTGFNVMMTQSGTDSTTVLGLMPRFLIVPAALSATAARLTGGGIVPETVSNVPLYGTGGPRPLEVIAEGQLDQLGSTTNWWFAADNNVIDTVEITFLQGEESPALERHDEFKTDTINYKIRQSYGIKAIDYRGLYQGNS